MESISPESQRSALAALQNELGRFVTEEHALQRETMRRLWASPLEERIEEGRCIAGAKITGQPEPKRWRLECDGNDSRFREGDLVRLSRGDPQLPFMEAMIVAVSDTQVEVQEWRALGDRPAMVGEKGICLDESFIDLEDRYRGAIEDLGKTAIGRDVILPLLQGGLRPEIDATEYDDALERAEEDGLNDKQKEAVANAVAADVCWLVQGPPGTGKTHVLAWVIVDLLRRGERILVTSFTHRAINNLLAAVAERLDGPGHIAKIDWMQDRAVTTLDDYLAVERIGRGVRLNAEQRRALHAVYRRYLGLLASRQEEDWSGRALRFWQGIERGTIRLPHYDYIYIDEAQFFAPVWLRALRSALKPRTGRLLLAADPTQGFLKRRQSWVACGLDIRGRSTRLRCSYRNTRPILTLAAEFYRSRMKDEEEADLNLPDEMELSSADPGEAPRIVPVTSRQDEVGRVLNELKGYLAEGGDPEAVLVLVASGQRTAGVHDELARALGAHRVGDARKAAVTRAVRVCSIDAATGLEAPIVFLIGGAELLERESDLQMAPEQREELRRDNTRRLYMAFTRAGMRLFITWVGQMPEVLQKRIG